MRFPNIFCRNELIQARGLPLENSPIDFDWFLSSGSVW